GGCVVAEPAPRLRFVSTSGAPVHSVTALVADAHTLQRENQELRAQYELVSAHNAGLATHASALHDRNLAILHRAREGYRAGMIRLEQALFSWEHAERDYAVLEGQVADFRARAKRADAAEALLRAERGSSTKQYRDLQTQLRAARDQAGATTRAPSVTAFASTSQPPKPPSLLSKRVAAAEAERDHMRQLVATAEQQRDAALAERDRVTPVLVVVEQECDGALDMRDQVRRASTALRRERDDAVTKRDQARRAVAALEQWRDAAVAERDQARQALTALEQQRAPVDEELRAALAHAEELRRSATCIHELKKSVATATTLRVAAESEMAQAQAGELCATSRAAQYRAGWLSIRRSSQQRRGPVGAQTHRLRTRVAELEEERDLAIRERDERAVAWRRMLRDARRGRELALWVRDELADRLAGVVTRVGGQIDTADLVRRLEATFTAEIDGAIPLPPAIPTSAAVPAASAVPVPASTASSSGARAGSSASTAGSTTGACPPAGPSGSRPVPTSFAASSSSGFRRPRHGASSRVGSQSHASRPSGVASATSSGSSPLRRSRRPSTVADTAASDNAAAQASSAATPSVAAAAAARAREDASLFGSESSDSEDQARRAQSKRRRLHSPGSRSRSPARPPPRSPSRSPARSPPRSPSRSWTPFCFAFAFPLGLSFAFALASTLALAFSLALLGVDAFGRLNAFGARGGVGGLASLFSCTADALLAEGPSGRRSWTRPCCDVSSASSSSRASSSSTASSGSAGSAPAAPFFDPVIPPAGTPSGWRQPRELRTLFLPPPGWIIPRRVPPAPANWNRALVTLANVDALYATRPWRYLAQAAEALLFASGDPAFRPFLRRLRHHIEHWAQAYWEATHELFVQGAAWKRWRTARNSRRSHAGNHLNSLLQLVVGLFQQGLADMDLLLDPMMLHFPPAHTSIGRWYPGLQHATLQATLDDIDTQEPWRRFYRTPLTVAEMDANP
ncbi:hypothetical protein PHYSODRAFT_256786, partial [Phytophthora sojae]